MCAMEMLDNAGHAVLYSYGQFFDSLFLNLYHINYSFSSLNNLSDSIGIQIIQEEHLTFGDLLNIDSKPQRNMLIVFSAICKEIDLLKNELETYILKKILDYGENITNELNIEDLQITFSNFLPVLLDVLNFIRRCRQTLVHFLRQLFSLFEYNWKMESQNSMYLKYKEVFEHLDNLLLIFVTLDVAFSLRKEDKITKHMNLFWRYIKQLEENNEVIKINKVIQEINDEMLSDGIFQISLNILIEKKIFSVNSEKFFCLFNRYLKKKISEIENSKNLDALSLKSLSFVVSSYVFSTKCFGRNDRKLFNNISQASKKYFSAPLFGDLIWIPEKFLVDQIGTKNTNQSTKYFGLGTLKKKLELIEGDSSKDVKYFSFLVFKWALQIQNSASPDAIFSRLNCIDLAHLGMEGLLLAHQIKFCIDNILQIHDMHERPMTKNMVMNLWKLIELLRGIQSLFNQHNREIGKQINHIFQKRVMQILPTILKLKKDVFKTAFKEKYLDSYSSLMLVEKMLYDSCSEDKILLLRLALTLTNDYPFLDCQANETILKLLNDLSNLCLLNVEFEKFDLQNFMFINENAVSFKSLLSTYSSTACLQVIKEFSEEIEVHLRLQAHSHLNDNSSFEVIKNDFYTILHGSSISMHGSFFNLKDLVESYLNKTFYSLTTIALNDWQIYSEIKSLAEHQFKLETLEDNLPSQTVSQGLDVLEIMRNIDVFVCKYLHNLNTQSFIECMATTKYINTVQIHQVANSIRTHGSGIINTTVNFIYQFLGKKLLHCSQFLHDEHINSRLIKDLKYFNQQKVNNHSMYSYERAEKFNRSISRLKVSSEGLSYLDQYRILISQIGNALGYMRMIRSGGMHHSVASMIYFPFDGYISLWENNEGDSKFNCIESFEMTLMNKFQHLNGEVDALKLLVDLFKSMFHTQENDHLNLFIMIIPPLTINFVNYIIGAKEKISKRNSISGLCDDGFAIGVAYLLSVFNLIEEFNSLHWFECVAEKYDSEKNLLHRSMEKLDKDDIINDNSLKLSIKRFTIYKQEFELLKCNLNSAMVFFS